MKLSQAEEQLMQYIWELDEAYMKSIIDLYPEPKPAATTVATLLKRMQDKAFIAYKLNGNSRLYYPLVSRGDYFSGHVNKLIKNFFGNSALQFASFFTKETNLSTAELEDLKKIIDDQISKQKQ